MAKGGFGRVERGKTMAGAINRYFASKGLNYKASVRKAGPQVKDGNIKMSAKDGKKAVSQYRVDIRDSKGKRVAASTLAKRGEISLKDAQRINRLGNIGSKKAGLSGVNQKINKKMTKEFNSLDKKTEPAKLIKNVRKVGTRDVKERMKQANTVSRISAKKAQAGKAAFYNKMPVNRRSIPLVKGGTAKATTRMNKKNELVVNFGGKKQSKAVMARAEALAKSVGATGVKASNFKKTATTTKKKK